MNKLPLLAKMFLLLVCVSFVLTASNVGSTINDILNIPTVEFAPVIDGEMDAEWTFPNVQMFVYIFEQADSFEGYADFSSFYRAAWNEDGFYLYGQVMDDTISGAFDAASYNNDCFEIYFDGGNEKNSGSYDTNDVQWRYVYGMTADSAGWCDLGTSGECAWTEITGGYTFELALPTEVLVKDDAPLFALDEGTIIGWEVQVADNDGSGREAMTKWWSNSNDSWMDPSIFGTAMLAGTVDEEELLIPKVEFSPTIDGELGDEWVDVESAPAPKVTMSAYIDESGFFGGATDISSSYRAMWNEDGFYFFGEVIDEYVSGTSDAASYNNDCFEIYFDGGNEKNSGSYDTNDVQWRYVYGMTADSAGWCDLSTSGECAWMETDTGYTFELALPTDILVKDDAPLFALDEGTIIGWEVQVADNDSSGREAMTKWWSESNDSWMDPSIFGTAQLSLTSGVEEEAAVSDIALSAPAVISAGATVSYNIAARSSVKVSLVNLAGQVVKVLDSGVKSAGTHTAALDADGLANGVYFVNLNACNTSASDKVLLIK